MTEPNTSEKATQGLRILRWLQGQRPLTVHSIKEGMGVTTQTASARCSELEIIGLLTASTSSIVRGNHVSEAKAYSLSPIAYIALSRDDARDILRAAMRELNRLSALRAIEMREQKQTWLVEMRRSTRDELMKALQQSMNGGTK